MRLSVPLAPSLMKKDLRLRMRGWRWAGVTTVYVFLLGLIVIGFLLQKYGPTTDQTAQSGIQLFQALAIFQLCLIVFVTPTSMAGAISGERQHRTWDLLVTSRLSALEIVGGKLLVGLASNFLLIGASLPLFALVFMFGGVGPGDLIRALVVFLATVLLLATTSLAVSALTARVTVAMLGSLLVALGLAGGVTALVVVLQAPGQLSLVSLAGTPFQSTTTPTALTPLAQMDPLMALLSALPAESGGTLLGSTGAVHHAFGLPWQLPLWGAYTLVSVVLSSILLAVTAVLVSRPSRTRSRGPLPARPQPESAP